MCKTPIIHRCVKPIIHKGTKQGIENLFSAKFKPGATFRADHGLPLQIGGGIRFLIAGRSTGHFEK